MIEMENFLIKEKIEIDKEDLRKIIKEAYRHGFASFEMVDAGLESYDADGYANWQLIKLKHTKNEKIYKTRD